MRKQKQVEQQVEAEGEAGAPWGAQCGTRSQDPGVTPWAEGRRSTAEPPGAPVMVYFTALSLPGYKGGVFRLFVCFDFKGKGTTGHWATSAARSEALHTCEFVSALKDVRDGARFSFYK